MAFLKGMPQNARGEAPLHLPRYAGSEARAMRLSS